MGTIKEKIERLKKEPEEAMNGPAITHPLSVGTRPKAGEPIPAGKPKRDRRIDVFLSPALLTQTLHVVAFKDAEYPGLRVQKFASDRCVGNDPFVPIGLQGAPADAEHTPDLLAGQVEAKRQENSALAADIAAGGTQEKMEEIARNELGMVFPGEYVLCDGID